MIIGTDSKLSTSTDANLILAQYSSTATSLTITLISNDFNPTGYPIAISSSVATLAYGGGGNSGYLLTGYHSANHPEIVGTSINPVSTASGAGFMRCKIVFPAAPVAGLNYRIYWPDPTLMSSIKIDQGNGNEYVGAVLGNASNFVTALSGPNKIDIALAQFATTAFVIGADASGTICPMPPCTYPIVSKAYSIDPAASRVQVLAGGAAAPSRAYKTTQQDFATVGYNHISWDGVVGSGKIDPTGNWLQYPTTNPGATRIIKAIIRGRVTDTAGAAKIVLRMYRTIDGITFTPLMVDEPFSLVSAAAASATVKFSANPANSNMLGFNGSQVIFRTSASGAGQIQIGADLPTTLATLVAALNSSTDAQISQCVYLSNGVDSLYITYKASGQGLAFVISSNVANQTITGATTVGAGSTTLANIVSGEFALVVEAADTLALEGNAAVLPQPQYRVSVNILAATTTCSIYGQAQAQSTISVQEINPF